MTPLAGLGSSGPGLGHGPQAPHGRKQRRPDLAPGRLSCLERAAADPRWLKPPSFCSLTARLKLRPFKTAPGIVWELVRELM